MIFVFFCCRTPHGVRGLKFRRNGNYAAYVRRTPHGVRGFRKFLQTMNILGDELGLLKRSRDRTENMILFCIIVRHACINHNLPVVIQRVNKKYNMI